MTGSPASPLEMGYWSFWRPHITEKVAGFSPPSSRNNGKLRISSWPKKVPLGLDFFGDEYLVIQNMFYCIPYPNKCVCSYQNCEAMSILSGDITVLRFWRPSWTPSLILERAPVGFTGSLDMLFLMVLGMFPEKFSFGLCFAPSEWYHI